MYSLNALLIIHVSSFALPNRPVPLKGGNTGNEIAKDSNSNVQLNTITQRLSIDKINHEDEATSNVYASNENDKKKDGLNRMESDLSPFEKHNPSQITQANDTNDFDHYDEDFHNKVAIDYKPEVILDPNSNQNNESQARTVFPSQFTGGLVPPQAGFVNTTIHHGSTMFTTRMNFDVTFAQDLSDSLMNSLSFWPQTNFRWEMINNRTARIFPEELKRNTQYTFGLKSQSICIQPSGIACEQGDTYAYRLDFITDWKEHRIYGKSVDGRDLSAFIYGECNNDQCKRIMLTGGIHGSEWRSGDLTRLMNYIESNPSEIIGKNKVLIIIPFANPDGTARNLRYNSRGVNLNRNFSSFWVGCKQCGEGPASEPETSALEAFTLEQKPQFLISYHAQWPPHGMIFRGDDNNTDTQWFARWVADRTGYPIGYYPSFEVVPGDQSVWAETKGVRSIIIEATYLENSDWNKNFGMYLGLLRDF